MGPGHRQEPTPRGGLRLERLRANASLNALEIQRQFEVEPWRGREDGGGEREGADLVAAAPRPDATGVSPSSRRRPTRSLAAKPSTQSGDVDRDDLDFERRRRAWESLTWTLDRAELRNRHPLKIVRSFVRGVLNTDGSELVTLCESGPLQGPQRAIVRDLRNAFFERLAGLLDSGAQAGKVRVCDFDLAARAVVGLVSWAPHLSCPQLALAPVSRHRLGEAVEGLVTYGRSLYRSTWVEAPRLDLDQLIDLRRLRCGRRPAQIAREAILISASRLFNRRGVDETSMQDLGAELSLSEQALRDYVGDKPQIVRDCHARAYEVFAFIEDEAARLGGTAEACDLAVTRAVAEAYLREDIQPLRPLAGLASLAAQARQIIVIRWRTQSALLHDRHAQGQAEGQMRTLRADLAPLAGPGAVHWLAAGMVDSDHTRQAHIAEEVAQFMRLGLAPP